MQLLESECDHQLLRSHIITFTVLSECWTTASVPFSCHRADRKENLQRKLEGISGRQEEVVLQ